MFCLVEHEKSFITSNPGWVIALLEFVEDLANPKIDEHVAKMTF